MNDFIGGFLVCSLIVSPFLTYFTLKEISWRRNIKALEKISQENQKPVPEPIEQETFEALREAEEILQIPQKKDEDVNTS